MHNCAQNDEIHQPYLRGRKYTVVRGSNGQSRRAGGGADGAKGEGAESEGRERRAASERESSSSSVGDGAKRKEEAPPLAALLYCLCLLAALRKALGALRPTRCWVVISNVPRRSKVKARVELGGWVFRGRVTEPAEGGVRASTLSFCAAWPQAESRASLLAPSSFPLSASSSALCSTAAVRAPPPPQRLRHYRRACAPARSLARSLVISLALPLTPSVERGSISLLVSPACSRVRGLSQGVLAQAAPHTAARIPLTLGSSASTAWPLCAAVHSRPSLRSLSPASPAPSPPPHACSAREQHTEHRPTLPRASCT